LALLIGREPSSVPSREVLLDKGANSLAVLRREALEDYADSSGAARARDPRPCGHRGAGRLQVEMQFQFFIEADLCAHVKKHAGGSQVDARRLKTREAFDTMDARAETQAPLAASLDLKSAGNLLEKRRQVVGMEGTSEHGNLSHLRHIASLSSRARQKDDA